MSMIGLRVARSAWRRVAIVALAAFVATAGAAAAQTTFGGGFGHDSSQPIEVSADSLEVRNADNVAVFRGKVRVKQGEVVMTARELRVRYAQGGSEGAIDQLKAIGDVVITNGKDTATSDAADYNVAAGQVLLTGKVLLVQGRNAIEGDRLRIDLASGTAKMEGPQRVRVLIDPAEAQKRQ